MLGAAPKGRKPTRSDGGRVVAAINLQSGPNEGIRRVLASAMMRGIAEGSSGINGINQDPSLGPH